MNALKDTFNYIETGEYPEGYFDEPAAMDESSDFDIKEDVDDWFSEIESK